MGDHRASGGRLMLYTSVAVQGLALVRNVAIARILGPHEFGLAAIIILTVSFLDAMSNAGTQNILVQAKEDDDGRLLASVHAVSVARGFATVALMLILAAPLIKIFNIDLSLSALALVATASLIAGFTHRGIKSVQRVGDFRAESLTQFASEIGNLAVAIPFAIVTHSYLSIVAGLIARSVVGVVMSHVLVKLPYQLKWSRDEMNRLWLFSWPLLINGPLLFISAQADRLIVNTTSGSAALGIYSAIAVLVMSPSTAILKWLGTIYFPPFTKYYHKHNGLDKSPPVFNYTSSYVSIAWAMAAGFVCFGPFIVSMLYGPKYNAPQILVGLIGLLQIVRFLRGWPSILSMTAAKSSAILVSTIVRLAMLPLAFVGASLIGGLSGVIAGLILGELLALAVSLVLANKNAGRVPISGLFTTIAFVVSALALLVVLRPSGLGPVYTVLIFLFAAVVGVPALVFSLSPSEARELWQRLLRGRLPRR